MSCSLYFGVYRTYDNVDNEAHCALRFAESLEKMDLHMDNPEKYGDLSEAQKEALERSKKWGKQLIDNKFFHSGKTIINIATLHDRH